MYPKKTQNTNDKREENKQVIDINQTLFLIILTANGSDTPVKRQRLLDQI